MRLDCGYVAVRISRLARFLEDIRAGPRPAVESAREGHMTLLQSGSRSVLHVGWAQGQCQWVSRTNRATAPPKVFAEFALRRKMDGSVRLAVFLRCLNYGMFLEFCLPLYVTLIYTYEFFFHKT